MFPSMVIKFYLTNAKKESKLRIAIIIGRSYQFKIASKFTVEPKHWDSKNQRAKKTMIGYEVLNQSLDELKMNLLKYIRLTIRPVNIHIPGWIINKSFIPVNMKFFKRVHQTQYGITMRSCLNIKITCVEPSPYRQPRNMFQRFIFCLG